MVLQSQGKPNEIVQGEFFRLNGDPMASAIERDDAVLPRQVQLVALNVKAAEAISRERLELVL